MVQFTLLQKLKMLIDTILSSSFFLATVVLGLLFVIIILFNIKRKKKTDKIVLVLAWIFVIAFILIRYFGTLFGMLDNLIDNIFLTIYFPNLATYVLIIVFSNVILIYTILSKKATKLLSFVNIFSYICMSILFFLIADTVVIEKINIYEKLTAYSNSKLLMLLELSTGLFTIWMIVLFIIWFVNKMVLINKINTRDTVEGKKVDREVLSANKAEPEVIRYDLPAKKQNIELIDDSLLTVPGTNDNSIVVEQQDYNNLLTRFQNGDSNLSIDEYKNLKEFLLKEKK